MIRNKFFILLTTFTINGVGRISRIRYTTEITEPTLRISVIRWFRAWWHSSYLWSSITNLVHRNLWRGSLLEVVRWMYNSQRFKSTLAPLDVKIECQFFYKQSQLGPNFSDGGWAFLCLHLFENISLTSKRNHYYWWTFKKHLCFITRVKFWIKSIWKHEMLHYWNLRI